MAKGAGAVRGGAHPPEPAPVARARLRGLTAPDVKVDVGITQEIAAYLQRPHRAGAADARLRAAAEEALAVALDVVAALRERYVTLQSIQAQLPVLRERRDILARLRDFEQLKVDRGEGVRADVTTLDAERAAISVDLAEREAELREGRVALARLVGRPTSAAVWSLDPAGVPDAPAGDERAWIATALARRPEIRALAGSSQRSARNVRSSPRGSGRAARSAAQGVRRGAHDRPRPRAPAPSPRPERAARSRGGRRGGRASPQDHRDAPRRDRRRPHGVGGAGRGTPDAGRRLARAPPAPRTPARRGEATFRAGESDVVALLLADQALQEVRARRIDLEGRAALARIRLERAAGGPDAAPAPPHGPHDSNDGGTPR